MNPDPGPQPNKLVRSCAVAIICKFLEVEWSPVCGIFQELISIVDSNRRAFDFVLFLVLAIPQPERSPDPTDPSK